MSRRKFRHRYKSNHARIERKHGQVYATLRSRELVELSNGNDSLCGMGSTTEAALRDLASLIEALRESSASGGTTSEPSRGQR
jgi:hypothetical protein